MNVKKYFYFIVAALALLLLLAVALSAEFSLARITADPYGFFIRFMEIWAPAAGSVGTIIIAIVIVFVLSYIHQSQEKDKEHALHD
jgi:hypothetical protein